MTSQQERDASPVNPYRVRKQVSGYSGAVSYIVVKLRKGQPAARVSVHADAARYITQASADRLNVRHLVKDHAEDPRPYDERRADAEVEYREICAKLTRRETLRAAGVL